MIARSFNHRRSTCHSSKQGNLPRCITGFSDCSFGVQENGDSKSLPRYGKALRFLNDLPGTLEPPIRFSSALKSSEKEKRFLGFGVEQEREARSCLVRSPTARSPVATTPVTDHYTLSVTLIASANHRNTVLGTQLHAHTIRAWLKSYPHVANTLLSLYVKSEDLVSVKRIFSEIENPDVFLQRGMQ
ncbi:hypothetical protein U1Q18_004260 [Sarracenia purpurea var. burkii]